MFAQPAQCLLLFLFVLTLSTSARAQQIRGQVQDENAAPLPYANVALYTPDSTLAKVETTDDAGLFRIQNVTAGTYRLVVSFIGYPEIQREGVAVTAGETTDLGVLQLELGGVELAEATVTATRALVEVKPDRTVFNVQGTINAVGNNGLDLLRKAPGVTIDNNDNINVLSRAGVLLYVDGKRLPLQGQDLSNYLRNLTAEQIDRIDIITNPSAKYEAEGNAGIIDIRLKKAENEGANGSLSGAYSQGRYAQYNLNANGNYRNRQLNIFGSLGYSSTYWWNELTFDSYQNNLFLDEETQSFNDNRTPSYRLGVDFYVAPKHTVGFLVGGQYTDTESRSQNDIDIYSLRDDVILPNPDSLLRAGGLSDMDRGQNTFNLNYRFDIDQGRSLNVDLDYGRYRNDQLRDQPNVYLTPEGNFSSAFYNYFDTPVDIDIYTAKADYETSLGAGALSLGTKYSQVETFNTFQFFDVLGSQTGERVLNTARSNQFDYDERVYAGYASYAGKFSDAWSYSAGLRVELTDATGILTPFEEQRAEDPVEFNYVSLFPNAGITYALNAQAGNTLNLNYGRRINRPDYNVLNPFRNQLSQLSYERGNPFLNPEIVDNIELGYTHGYRYNFKLAYSRTSNQITRLIGPDDIDPRAGFISWDNLANQTLYAFNVSAPFTISERWNLYVNGNAAYLSNQADYGDEGGVIDLQVFTYNFFVQNTINLPWDLTAEIGGYYSGPGVWGGVFEYRQSGAFNLGLQRKFLNNALNVKVSGNDLFLTSPWRGVSSFNGLVSEGRGRWDSRRVGISLSYNFGNQQVKSRNRKTGLEQEAGRVGG